MTSQLNQLKLKVIWLPNLLGISVDQILINSSAFSRALTTYYFWPKVEVWEQLKTELDTLGWLSEKEKVKILNRISDLLNYWQLNRNVKLLEAVKKELVDISFVEL